MWIRGPLKNLNGTKLILDDLGNHLDSYAISLESFRSFRGPPVPQTSNWSGTFFCLFLQLTGSRENLFFANFIIRKLSFVKCSAFGSSHFCVSFSHEKETWEDYLRENVKHKILSIQFQFQREIVSEKFCHLHTWHQRRPAGKMAPTRVFCWCWSMRSAFQGTVVCKLIKCKSFFKLSKLVQRGPLVHIYLTFLLFKHG